MMKRLFFLIIISTIISACTPVRPAQEPVVNPSRLDVYPRNVILMIGDGMGLTQITAGMYANGNRLNLERCTVTGLHKSYASDNLVTDSAAGATAFSCGIKTYNGAIGVDANGRPVKTILEYSEQHGLATGLISSTSITHATPASFIAHVSSRDAEEAIALFFADSGIDLFIGGGKKYFDRRNTDERDLITTLQKNGYFISHYAESELAELIFDPTKPLGFFTADGSPLTRESGRDYLPVAVRKSIPFLQSRSQKGFFLMIEGGQIDWGGHANDTRYIIREMIDFDEAIGIALDFAQADGKTLVVITADHETGGFAINPGSRMDTIAGAFTTDQHTAALIPVFAYGPGSELFGGVYENTAVYQKLMMALGLNR